MDGSIIAHIDGYQEGFIEADIKATRVKEGSQQTFEIKQGWASQEGMGVISILDNMEVLLKNVTDRMLQHS